MPGFIGLNQYPFAFNEMTNLLPKRIDSLHWISIYYDEKIHFFQRDNYPSEHFSINKNGENYIQYQSVNLCFDSHPFVYNNKIYLIGRQTLEGQRYLYSWDGESYEQIIELPYNSSKMLTANSETRVYLIGGSGSASESISFYSLALDGSEDSWTDEGGLMDPVAENDGRGNNAIVFGDYLYIFGGYGLGKYTTVYYTKITGSYFRLWRTSQMPYEFTGTNPGCAALIANGVVHLVQMPEFNLGRESKIFKHYIYDGQQYKKSADLPILQKYYIPISDGNNLYILGGSDKFRDYPPSEKGCGCHWYNGVAVSSQIATIKAGWINAKSKVYSYRKLEGEEIHFMELYVGNEFDSNIPYYEDGDGEIDTYKITEDQSPDPSKNYYTNKYADSGLYQYINNEYVYDNLNEIDLVNNTYYEYNPGYTHEKKRIKKVFMGNEDGKPIQIMDASYWIKFISYPDLQEKKILFKVECGENLFIGLADGTLYVYDGRTVTNLGVQENAPISTNYIGDAMEIDDTTFVFCNCEQEIVGKIKGYIYIYYGTYENGIFNWSKKKVKALDNNFLQYSDVNLVFTASYFFKINNIPFIYLQNWRRNETSTTRPKSAIVDHSYSDFDRCGIYKLDLTSMGSGEYYIFTDGSSYGGRGAGQISDSRLINRTFDSNVGTAWYTDIVSQCISSKPAVIDDDVYVLGYYTSFGMKYTASPKKYEILDKKVTFTLMKFHYDGQKSMPLVQETDLSGMGINIEPQSTTVFNVIVAHDSQLYLFDWTNNYWYLIDLSEETPKLIMQKNNGVMGLPFNVLAEKMPDTYNLNYYPYYDHFKYLSTYEQNGKTPIVYEDHILLFPEDESIKIYKSNPEGYFS